METKDIVKAVNGRQRQMFVKCKPAEEKRDRKIKKMINLKV